MDDEAGPDDRRQRRRARAVTYGLIVVLLYAGAAQVEAWPLTAYRLFSGVRTDTGVQYRLVAVAPDGTRTPVVPTDPTEVSDQTSHLLPALRGASPERRRAMVDAWLDAAGLDPADVAQVRLERVTRRMDPRSLTWTDTDRTLVTEVTP